MTSDDALRVVGIIGERLVRTPDARRDITALTVLVADLAGWPAASDFASALGLEGDQLEVVYQSWRKGQKR